MAACGHGSTGSGTATTCASVLPAAYHSVTWTATWPRFVEEVKRRRAQVRARADADLEAMARRINRAYFDGEIDWHSIRWVSNMRKRLGSCTTGGPTDGDIRISDRIKGWPPWVIEYVVAHEMAHRKHPNHSKEFWTYLSRYPKAERARGFIQGAAFQLEKDPEDWL